MEILRKYSDHLSLNPVLDRFPSLDGSPTHPGSWLLYKTLTHSCYSLKLARRVRRWPNIKLTLMSMSRSVTGKTPSC